MDFNDIAQKTIHLVVEVGNFIRKEREGLNRIPLFQRVVTIL
jgi:hypothetical protein